MRARLSLLNCVVPLLLAACGGGGGGASASSSTDTGGGTGGTTPTYNTTLTLTLPASGLGAADLAVIVAEGDTVSEGIGAAYLAARGVPAANLIRVKVNTASDVITATDFAALKADIDAKIAAAAPGVQATLFAWGAPSRVQGACSMGITSAMTLGFDTKYCNPTPTPATACTNTAASALYDSETRRPQTDLKLRPSMLLGSRTLAAAQALISRGVAADGTLPAGDGWLVRTSDSDRSVRYSDFVTLPAGYTGALTLNYVDNSAGAAANSLSAKTNVLFYLTGLSAVSNLSTLQFRPGALADTLTSFGGQLPAANGQMPITDWLDAGVTASYGTVEEPCNFQQKFSRASVLVDQYFRGATAIEAYWKAVQWPGQGLFVGEPLAQPFRDAPSLTIVGSQYRIKTRSLRPGSRYTLQYLQAGTWTTLATFTGARGQVLDSTASLAPAAATQLRWMGPCAENSANSCVLAQSP